MSVSAKERRLLIVSNLTDFGRPELKWLYQFISKSSVALARLILGLSYEEVSVLEGGDATSHEFVDRLTQLSRCEGTKAVDVLLHLHGGDRVLWFADGPMSTPELSELIRRRKLSDRLRLLYSTACYGGTHAQDFVDAGFCTASGARATNANAAHDYSVQLGTWALRRTYAQALRAGNKKIFCELYDGLARRMGFEDVDSRKIVKGDKEITIGSLPQP